MRKRNRTYNLGHRLASLVMLLALSWLTISAPFVYRAQQQQQQLAKQYAAAESTDEDYNPFSSTNEEKSGNGFNSLSEEYLHHAHHIDHHFTILVKSYNCPGVDEYLAYHPESFSPPPEA